MAGAADVGYHLLPSIEVLLWPAGRGSELKDGVGVVILDRGSVERKVVAELALWLVGCLPNRALTGRSGWKETLVRGK